MCAGGCCYFRPSKPHSGTLWGILTCLYFSSSYIHYSSLVNIERSWAEPSGLNIRYIPALKHIGYIPAVKIILNDRWSAVITTRGCCRELLGCWALFCILSSQQGGALTCWPLQTLETFNFDIDVVNSLLDESIYLYFHPLSLRIY